MGRAAQYEFIPTDPDEITGRMAAEYEAITGVTVQPGSPERQFIQWVAAVVVQERVLANYAANQNLPSRADGPNLDALAELVFARERPGAKAASCTVRFTISEPQTFAVLIPAKTRVTDASGTLVWETAGDVYITPGDTFADVQVFCQTAGSKGNGYVAGQIDTIVDRFAYFSDCKNITESDGGCGEASDEEFYELMRLSMDGYSCAGSRGGYIYFAKQVDTEIADVVPTSPTPGVVKLYVLMQDGRIAGEEIKRRVLAACSADEVRPMTDQVFVEDPEQVGYNVRLTYYTQEGEAGLAAIDDAVREAVDRYILWQSGKLGRDINPSRLYALLMETGIKRVELTEPVFTPLLDGSTGSPPQVAAIHNISITDGGYEDE